MSLHWILLFAATGASMGGQTLLKAAAGQAEFLDQLLDWRTITGLALYGGAAMLYIIALRKIPMSVALPSTAISYIAAALIGHFVFGEALGWTQLGAIALIGGGVVILALA